MPSPAPGVRRLTLSWFIVTVLGFSFWFFMAVPFASHRESYWWLAMVNNHGFVHAFAQNISVTFRPLAQAVIWASFLCLDATGFPTSVFFQTLFQSLVYALFVLAWWLIFSAAPHKRVFALSSFFAGFVFFAGYIHLFHIYGLMYAPVMLMLGAALRFQISTPFEKKELGLAIIAIVLALWHPFATALFLGFYFGLYLDTFSQRAPVGHLRAVAILLLGALTTIGLVATGGYRFSQADSRLFGFLVSFKTNEFHPVASFLALLATEVTVLSIPLSPKWKRAAVLGVTALGFACYVTGLPLLLLWLCAVLAKLLHLRQWRHFFLALTAALLPFGGGIGTPVYALFAIIVGAYVTPIGMADVETFLSRVRGRYIAGAVATMAAVVLMVRVGVDVPIVTRVAAPLLAERERTFQFESVLNWMHSSEYCRRQLAFVESAGSPVDSVDSAVTRRNRPPAALGDAQLFWDTVLRCRDRGHQDSNGTVVVTFGGPPLVRLRPVFSVPGRYAGEAVVWLED